MLDQSIWSYRHTVLATLGIFFYVGVEVGLANSWWDILACLKLAGDPQRLQQRQLSTIGQGFW